MNYNAQKKSVTKYIAQVGKARYIRYYNNWGIPAFLLGLKVGRVLQKHPNLEVQVWIEKNGQRRELGLLDKDDFEYGLKEGLKVKNWKDKMKAIYKKHAYDYINALKDEYKYMYLKDDNIWKLIDRITDDLSEWHEATKGDLTKIENLSHYELSAKEREDVVYELLQEEFIPRWEEKVDPEVFEELLEESLCDRTDLVDWLREEYYDVESVKKWFSLGIKDIETYLVFKNLGFEPEEVKKLLEVFSFKNLLQMIKKGKTKEEIFKEYLDKQTMKTVVSLFRKKL